jgi:hypothetical protein
MIGPTWLAAIFGVIMIVAAIASLVRMVVALRTRTATDYEIDAHNVLMGIAMAGMLIPGLFIVTVGPSITVWLVVWILITIWFGISVIRDASRRTAGHRFTGHHLPHLVMSGAMIYMFAVMGSGATGTGSSVTGMPGMSASGGLVPFPTLDYALVIFMIGYAVLVIDRLPRLSLVGTGVLQVAGHRGGAVAARPLAPTMAALTNIGMAITMGYMLTMMFV